MSDIKMSECCTCGTRWQTGQDGGHSCFRRLKQDNDALLAQVELMKEALHKIKGYEESERAEFCRIGYSESWLISSNSLAALEGVGDE